MNANGPHACHLKAIRLARSFVSAERGFADIRSEKEESPPGPAHAEIQGKLDKISIVPADSPNPGLFIC
jgi:hypothetical protein